MDLVQLLFVFVCIFCVMFLSEKGSPDKDRCMDEKKSREKGQVYEVRNGILQMRTVGYIYWFVYVWLLN